MKLKQIHNLTKGLVTVLESKVEQQESMKRLPQTSKEYTKGQLYEAQYINDIIEKIIYEGAEYNF